MMNKNYCLFFLFALYSILINAQCSNPKEYVVNGDFSAGNTGFSSDYIYCNTANCLTANNYYAVGANVFFYHNGASGTIYDHTTGTPSGSYAMYNGYDTPNKNLWCETMTICTSTTYTFSVWGVNWSSTSQYGARVELVINNIPVTVFNFPTVVSSPWALFSQTWNSGSSTSATVCLVDQELNGFGNDFGMDDISFRGCSCDFSPGYNVSICSGTSTALSASGGISYLWNTGATVNNITVAPGSTSTYSLVMSNGSSLDTTRYVVTVYTTPTLTVSSNSTICAGNNTILTAGGANNYVWSPPGGLNTANGPNVIASPLITTNYFVTGDISGSCPVTATVTVNVYLVPSIAIITNAGSCNGGGTVTLDGGNSVYYNSYLWSPSGVVTETIDVPASGTYTLTLSNSNCSTSIPITLNVLPTINTSSPTTICLGNSATIFVTGGTSYIWSPAAGLSNPTGQTVIANPLTSTTYTILGTNQYGCSNTGNASVSVSVNPLPTININPSTISICKGSSTILNAIGNTVAPPVNYIWKPISGLSGNTTASVTALPTVAIVNYTVTGTDQNGCYNTAGVTITVNPLPTIAVSPNKLICQGVSVILSATGGMNYTWLSSNAQNAATGSIVVAAPTVNTTYTVIGTDNNNCSSLGTVNITVQSTPVITVSSNQTIAQGTATSLSATGVGTGILWLPSATLTCDNCLKPMASPTVTTTYYFTVTSANGCQSKDSILITVIPKQTCGDDIFVPNAFSPNADNQNDYLYIKTKDDNCILSMSFEIFDRWGNKVFESTDIKEGWDGKYKGKPLTPDVFVYRLQATFSDESSLNKKGNISLIK